MWVIIIFILAVFIATFAALVISARYSDYEEDIIVPKGRRFTSCKGCNHLISWTEKDALVKHNNGFLISCPQCKRVMKVFYEE